MEKGIKRSFIFNIDWRDVLMDYPAEVRYEVYDAIIEYAASGKLLDLKPLAKMAFSFIKKEMDYNNERYIEKVGKNRENGKKGGAPKGNRNAKKTKIKTTETTQNNRMVEKTTETTLNDNDNDNDIKEISLSREKEKTEIPEGYFTPDELVTKLSENSDWLRMQPINIRRQTGMEVAESDVLLLISDYVCKLKAEGIGYKSLEDARSHFANWAIKFLKTQGNGNNRANYTSKQEANEYAIGLLVRHGRELDEGMAGEVERPF